MAEFQPVLDLRAMEEVAAEVAEAPLELRNDFYRYYRDFGILIAPLSNDTVPEGADVEMRKTYFATIEPRANNQFYFSGGSAGKKLSVGYAVKDADGVPMGRAKVTVLPMAGTPGLGGFTLSHFWKTVSEDDETLTLDLKRILAPGSAELGKITSLRALWDGPIQAKLLEADLALIDLSAFASLNEGETARMLVELRATDGTKEETTLFPVRVTGADDPELTVTQADSEGIMMGGSGNDTLISRMNQSDHMTGGQGDDLFIIRDFADEVADADTILDFVPGRDTLRFEGPPAEIDTVGEVDGGIELRTVQGDTLTILGTGVTISALIGSNVDMETQTRPSNGGGRPAAMGSNGWDLVQTITIQNINFPRGVFQGFGFGTQ